MKMDITPMQMYWITSLDSVVAASLFVAVIFAVFAFITFGIMLDNCIHWLAPFLSGFMAFIFLLIVVFTPSTKQMAAILIIPKIANSEKVEKIGNGLYDLAVEWMNELKPTKKEGAK
jgi:hypothetical protein